MVDPPAGPESGHDRAAGERLVEWLGAHGDELFAYARRRVESDLVAEDLVQETFVVLTTKYAHVRALEECVPLGITILKMKMAAHLRKVRRRGEDTAVDPGEVGVPDGEANPEEAALRRQLVERLRAALPRLTGRCRDLARLKLEDRTFPEIAEILSAKLNTVYSWDHRCMERLRAILLPEVRR
jgi:RNA polymerase sigma factor (sigma-70 family)